MRFVEPPAGPEDSLLRDERLGKLIEFVRELPPRDRELISLKFDAELSNAEIMGLTPLNIRVAIFRALRRLRKRMQSDQMEESLM